ncbi:transposase [Deltaproteobacteria bacterium TL4]
MQYRRWYQQGGTYFFTVVTHQRIPILTQPDNINRLRSCFGKVMTRYPFHIDAIVILPDHLHALWRMPEGDHNFSTRWRLVKSCFSKGISTPVNSRGEKQIWQHRFWEHLIRDEDDWRRHMDYIHYNPVKHGLVNSPKDWPYGSFEKMVAEGIYPESWGSQMPQNIEEMEIE